MSKKEIFLIVLLSYFAGNLYAVPVQWSVADGGNGHYYEVVSVPESIIWSDAKIAAEASGGYLATITSSQENEFVFNLTDNPIFWH
jgi:hypothetical protein